MSKLIQLSIAVVLVAMAVLLYVLEKAGLFRSVSMQRASLGPYLVLYKNVVGPYNQISKHCNALCKEVVSMGLVHKSNVSQCTIMCLYYDNPKVTASAACRASVGYVFKQGNSIVSERDIAKYKHWLTQLSVVRTGEMKIGYFPAADCLAVPWPLRISLSVLVAVMRVYPRLEKAFRDLQGQGKAPEQLQGALEVITPDGNGQSTLWIAFPLTHRTEMLPFDLPVVNGKDGMKSKDQ